MTSPSMGHPPDVQLRAVAAFDDSAKSLPADHERFIVPSAWIKSWLEYTHFKVRSTPPPPIDNMVLLNNDSKPKTNLSPNVHYRHVNQETWSLYCKYYPNSGPEIKCLFKDVKEQDKWIVKKRGSLRLPTMFNLRRQVKFMKRIRKLLRRSGNIVSRKESKTSNEDNNILQNLRSMSTDKHNLLFQSQKTRADANHMLDLCSIFSSKLDPVSGDACSESPNYIVSRPFAKHFLLYCLGVIKDVPPPLDNEVLLEKEETPTGLAWKQRQGLKCDNTSTSSNLTANESDYIYVNEEAWGLIKYFLRGSGPKITVEDQATFTPWDIDESFLLNREMGFDQEEERFFTVNPASVAYMFDNKSEKVMSEKENEEKQVEEEIKSEEVQIVANVFAGSLVDERKSSMEEKQAELDNEILEDSLAYFSKPKSKSEDPEYNAANKIQHFLMAKTRKIKMDKKREELRIRAEIWAATKFQCSYRTMIARRRVKELKIKREKLRREISSIRLQNWWRINLAKISLSKKKQERRKQVMAINAISKTWRGRTAKLEFQMKKRGCTLISTKIRQINALKQTRKMKRSQCSVPIRIRVLSATKLVEEENEVDDDASVASFASVSSRKSTFRQSMTSALSPKMMNKESSPRVYISGFTGDMAKTTSSAKTGKKRNTNNPIFDETLPLCGDKFCGSSKVVLTVLNHKKVGNHKFLGQAVLDLQTILPDTFFDYKNASVGVKCENVLLKKYKIPCGDFSQGFSDGGVAMKIDGTDADGGGLINVEFLPSDEKISHCGWMEISSKGSMFGGNKETWNTRWCCLIDGRFTSHASPYRLHEIEQELTRDEVIGVEVEESNKTKEIVINTSNKKLQTRIKAVIGGSGGAAVAKSTAFTEDVWARKLKKAYT